MPGPDLLVVAPETFWRCLWTGAVAQISRNLVPCTPTSQHPLPGPRHYGPAQSPSYTNEPGSGSSSFSFRRGKAGRRDSGYFRNTLYMISTAFFRMYGLVCDICRSRCQSVPLDAMPCAPVCSPATPSQLTHTHLHTCPALLLQRSHLTSIPRKKTLSPASHLQAPPTQGSLSSVLGGTKTCLPASATLRLASAG